MNAIDPAAFGEGAAPYGDARPLAIARWLLLVAFLVVAMVGIGGITRLTESGLSITEWKPITGALPPLNEAQWQAEFDAYRQIPEYIEVNGPAGMTLAQYKFIYFWEWAHRLLGRLIGLAFALPLAWFWMRRAIPAGYKPRLVALLALGGLQGVFGWLMVRSGVGEAAQDAMRTDVSHYWLSIHLMTALFTLAGLVWTALDLRNLYRGLPPARLTLPVIGIALVVALQLLYGAWMAGLNAGFVAAGWPGGWPLMQGHLIPEGIDWSMGVLHAFTADPFLVHFIHRWWAFAAVAALVVLARLVRRKAQRLPSVAIHVTFGTQILLGIATVWTGISLWVAVSHQVMGALVVMATAWGAHVVGYRDRMPGSVLK